METHVSEIDGDLMVLKADGGLNTATAGQLSQAVAKLVEGGVRRIIVDCRALEVISSLGLGSLLMLHTRMKRVGGEVKLSGLTSSAMQVVRMTRLDKVFECYDDLDRAKLAFRPPAQG